MPIQHTRTLFDYTPFIAMVIAIGVALMQYYLQRQQQKQNLFEKRWKAYWEIYSCIQAAINTEAHNDLSHITETLNQVYYVQFLFGREAVRFTLSVAATLAQVEIDLLNLEGYTSSHLGRAVPDPSTDDPEYLKLTASRKKTVANLRRLAREQHRVFHPYLQLHYWDNPMARLIRVADTWMQSRSDVLDSRYEDQL